MSLPPKTLSRRAVLTSGAATALATTATAPLRAETATDSAFTFEVTRTDEEWRAMLTPEEYEVLRVGETEPRHTSPLVDETAEGTYHCRGCDLPIYLSEWKEQLDIGWVFFVHGIPNASLMRIDGPGQGGRYLSDGTDTAIVSPIAARCRRCGSHHGHILTVEGNTLHCINGSALVFRPAAA